MLVDILIQMLTSVRFWGFFFSTFFFSVFFWFKPIQKRYLKEDNGQCKEKNLEASDIQYEKHWKYLGLFKVQSIPSAEKSGLRNNKNGIPVFPCLDCPDSGKSKILGKIFPVIFFVQLEWK